MRKLMRKSLSLILAVAVITSCMVFAVPKSSAASLPSGLLNNGTDAVTYTASDAAVGKYLVEIDAVKFTNDSAAKPGAIASDAGNITITYKPDNGVSAVITKQLTGIIHANEFNAAGDKTVAYYAVVDGFPTKANISVMKNNVSDNDAGLYAEIKIWDLGLGYFTNIFDYKQLQKSNGVGTSNLMFSDISSLLQYYPYAFSGSANSTSFTLPSGVTTSASANVTFSVADQWGVTMIKPNVTYPEVVGLTFSRNNNVMTVSGTGDANNVSASTRTVNLSATYETLNPNAGSSLSATSTVTVNNSSTATYAPTYANREKGGLTVSFKAGSSNAEKFALDSNYAMTTTNYIYIKNNSSRTANITDISTESSGRFAFQTTTTKLAAGASTTIKLIDKKSGSGSYEAKTTVTYTLDNFYNASTGSLVNLTASANIPFIYNNVTTPSIHVYDKPAARKIDVYVGLQANTGVLNQTGKSDGVEKCTWSADYYVNRDDASTYDAAKLGFLITTNYTNHYTFQAENNYAGTYLLEGNYSSCGTFGFTSSSPTACTSSVKEVTNTEIGTGSAGLTKFIDFYGNIFAPSTTSADPARIKFENLQVHCPTVVSNSAYFSCDLNVYAYSKSALRSRISSVLSKSPISCYYNADKWSKYEGMNASSALQEAQSLLGTDMTNQKAINDASANLLTAYNNVLAASSQGTYAVNHYKHSGDINSAIVASSVDFYAFEKGASDSLQLNSDFSSATNKHSAAYTATLSSLTTYVYTYHYWNIDFTALNALLDTYDTVSANGQFTNTEEAIGTEYAEVKAIDRSDSSDSPTVQNDVDLKTNALATAMRKLEYLSYDMSVTHKMLNPTGTDEISNDLIKTYTETYNKTTTYGEYVDGTADINDGSYTIKGVHYAPLTDAKFMSYASNYYVGGVSSSYICASSKDITITYYAKAIEDQTLTNMINDTLTNINEWKTKYTSQSLTAFEDWFNTNYDDGTLTYGFSVFDTDDYNAVVSEYQAELAKLDTLVTEAQKNTITQFQSDYDMIDFMPKAYCNGQSMLDTYKSVYGECTDFLKLVSDNNAGSKAAEALIESFKDFKAVVHTAAGHKLLAAPTDGVDGKYYVPCSTCDEVIESGNIAHPTFNNLVVPAYTYSNRGAALRYDSEEVTASTQGMRFPASCLVPQGATVVDFGFVYTQTKYLNNGVEPTDNTVTNVDSLISGGLYIQKASMKDGHFTVRTADDGTVYSFNLVINVDKANWAKHYAARSYVVYSIDGVEVTVYDKTYSSRSATYLAGCIVNSLSETSAAKTFIAQKFGL